MPKPKQKTLVPMSTLHRCAVYARTNHQTVFRPTPAQRRRIAQKARAQR